jgi:hypothetical protein
MARRFLGASGRLVWPLLLVLAAVVLVPLHVHTYTQLSPIDELQHYDYVERAPGLQPVVSGVRVGQDALREQACRRIDGAFDPPPCGLPRYRAEAFQEEGYNTAYIHPPTYYSITSGAASVLETVAGRSTFGGARLTGTAWLAAGLLLSYTLALRLGASRVAATGVLLLLCATPGLLYWHAVINPDAAALSVGAGIVLLALTWERVRRSGWRTRGAWALLALAGVLGTAVKLQNLLLLLTVGLYFAVRAARSWAVARSVRHAGPARSAGSAAGTADRPVAAAQRVRSGSRPLLPLGQPLRRVRDYVAGTAVLGLSGVVVAVVWTRAIDANALVPMDDLPMSRRFAVGAFPLHEVTAHVGVFLTPVSESYVPFVLQHGSVRAVSTVAAALLVAGVVAAALFSPAGLRPERADLGRALLVLALVGGPVFVALNYLGNGQFLDVPPRYGLALVGPMAAVTATQLRGRVVPWLVLATGVLAVAVTVSALLRP